jgi:DtxR family Mn-dependent transcriptional regulator
MPRGLSVGTGMPAALLSRMRLRNSRTDAADALAGGLGRQSGGGTVRPMNIDERVEEVLERLWTLREQNLPARDDLEGEQFDFEAHPVVAEAQQRGWVTTTRNGLELTPAGEESAAGVIRRHRLAERLLFDVIQVDSQAMEAGACELEHSHILSEEATERVCTFLGHPPTCPHGRPIPRGRCCERFSHEIRPLVTPLSDSAIGTDYRIVFIASHSHRRLDRLCALGVVPGASLRLHQRAPAFIIKVAETDIALEPEVAADIFVVPR